MNKFLLIILSFIFSVAVFAQEEETKADDSILTADNKFLVPILILAIVFVGLAIYLISQDRRIKKLEKKIKEK